MINPFLLTDGYKTSHHKMYPEGTTLVFSNFTPRSEKHALVKTGYILHFGSQMVIQQIHELFQEGFFNRNRQEVLEEINKEYSAYLGTDYDVSHIDALHQLGHLPISVQALSEGVLVPIGIPVMKVWNTHPDFYWITNFLETIISNLYWKPITSATIAYEYRKLLQDYALATDKDNLGVVAFQGHDFSMRGMDSVEATMSSGLGHAVSFLGSDSLPVIHAARKYYEADGDVVYSVPASEHSVMCAGTKDDEIETLRYLMKQYPTGILSVVSDTWDLWKLITEYLVELKDEILARDGKLVIRPDSGDPVDIICGTFDFSKDKTIFGADPTLDTVRITEEKGVVELLWDIFGGTVNEQGYKVLDSHIGCIYGDSITLARAEDICSRLEAKGFASTNVVLGIGSYTYQYNTRDTYGFAMKATYVEVENPNIMLMSNPPQPKIEGREIFKDPVTDDGTKKSAKGLLAVHDKDGIYELKQQCTWEEVQEDDTILIYKDGKILERVSLNDVRNRVSKLLE